MSFSTPAIASRQHTTRPIVTGSSVLGIVYDGGVLLAADTLLLDGSLAKTQSAQRLRRIDHAQVVVGASGEYSDLQYINDLLQQKALEETTTTLIDSLYADASQAVTAATVWNYLRMIFYTSRRNKMNPLWNEILVAGIDTNNKDGTPTPFLGSVDKIGTTVKDHVLATGFGAYLALPILRRQWRPDLSEGEARADCMKICFYRDCRASSKIQLAKVTTDGTVLIGDPYSLETSWDAPEFVQPVAELDGDGGW